MSKVLKVLKVLAIIVASFIGVITTVFAVTYAYCYLKQADECDNQEMLEKCDPSGSYEVWATQECGVFRNKCASYLASTAPKTKLPPEESAGRKMGRERQQQELEQAKEEIEQSRNRNRAWSDRNR